MLTPVGDFLYKRVIDLSIMQHNRQLSKSEANKKNKTKKKDTYSEKHNEADEARSLAETEYSDI